jgi:hypothetical protein
MGQLKPMNRLVDFLHVPQALIGSSIRVISGQEFSLAKRV